MSYSLANKDSINYLPTYWVDKINETKVYYNVDIKNSIFFHAQVFPEYGEERIIVFDQDGEYKTHIIECRHVWESIEVTCLEEAKFDHQAKILAFTTSFIVD